MMIRRMHDNKGFSLIELMVSMVIGMFLIAGVFSVYLNGRSSQAVVNDQLELLENARFALDTISYDLRHAGLWGRINEYDSGLGNVSSDLVGNVAGECVPGSWVGNFSVPVGAFNDTNPYPGCVVDYASGDVLEVRYTLGSPVADANLQPDMIYVNSDVNQAEFFVGNTSPAVSTDAQNFQVVTNLYYISDFSNQPGDGIPALHRLSLEPGPEVVDRVLLSGIENLQVQYGLDTDDDGLVNIYMDPNAVAPTDWINVRTMQVTVVVRSLRNDPSLDTSFTANINGTPVDYVADGFRRYAISTVVKLRNQKNASGI